MTGNLPEAMRAYLPRPYRNAAFKHLRRGISDDAEVDVFVDAEGTFAVLCPSPVLDYSRYVPRQQKLGLGAYKKTLDPVGRRLTKIIDLFPERGSVLEIGAADGGFLAQLGARRPCLSLSSVEPDDDTLEGRRVLALAADFRTLADAVAAQITADVICLFHVFEHINEPAEFLEQVKRMLAPRGRLIIEVPSLADPLLSLYALPAYEAFYFQKQHPFVYSGRSLSRVITENGFKVDEIRPYQRYGLENHLSWLRRGRAGGDAALAAIFGPADSAYKAALEAKGHTDTVIAVARAA